MGDLISRSALLKQFKWNCEGRCQTCVHTTLVGKEELCSLIVDAPAVAEQKWIPCSERLPDENDYPEHDHRVLVLCKSGQVRIWPIKGIWMDRQTTREDDRYWHIAWMPLPEAYKGE